MLAIVGCDCHNGITLSQHLLEREGVAGWLSVPSYRGKSEGKKFIAEYGDIENADGQSLEHFIENVSSYSVIVGIKEEYGSWVNIGNGDVRSKTMAKQLIKLFAD